MTDPHERTALLRMTLTADSGYQSSETHRVSADQWERIMKIANEPAEEEQAKDREVFDPTDPCSRMYENEIIE